MHLTSEELDKICRWPLEQIKTQPEWAAAQTVLDAMLDAPSLTKKQQNYLYLLSLVVADYESRHEPMPDIHGVELLKVLIEERGLKQKDLVPIFKTESIISDVLHGRRQLTVRHIAELAKFFNVSPAVFFAVE